MNKNQIIGAREMQRPEEDSVNSLKSLPSDRSIFTNTCKQAKKKKGKGKKKKLDFRNKLRLFLVFTGKKKPSREQFKMICSREEGGGSEEERHGEENKGEIRIYFEGKKPLSLLQREKERD